MTETEVGYGIVGAGHLAQAIARRLALAGAPLGVVSSRTPERARALATEIGWVAASGPEEVLVRSRVTLICASDAAVSGLAIELATGLRLSDRVVAHCSGSQGLEPLEALRARGCALGVFHPLAPVPDGDPSSLDQSFISIEADPEARSALLELARLLECRVVEVGSVDRPLYHAAAVFAGVLPVLLEQLAERIARGAVVATDLAEALRSLHLASARNVARLGPERGLSGPQSRQDDGTVTADQEALRRFDPGLAQLYASIQKAARQLPADQSGKGG